MRKKVLIICCTLVILALMTMTAANVGAKSLYLIANHSTRQFDAWSINPNGTVEYQFKVNLVYASAPSDITIDESSNVMFITSEGTSSPYPMVEIVDATNMTTLGYVMGPSGAGSNHAGIEADDENNIVYVMKRGSATLYAFDWNAGSSSLTLKSGYPKTLTGGGYGIALDETTNILWVADGYNDIVRAYDVTTWIEDTNLSFTPSAHLPYGPIDVAIDRQRGFVYTVSSSYGHGGPGGGTKLSKYDVSLKNETSVDLGHQGLGVAVDEVTGYVYVTGDAYTRRLEGWDTSTKPWTQVDNESTTGSPAGICIPQAEVSYNPLNLSKDDNLGEECTSPGGNINYTICFDNMNDYNVTNVIIIDTLPENINFAEASIGGNYDSGNHTVSWDLGTIHSGEGDCLWLRGQIDSSTPPETILINYVTIDSDETPSTTVTETTLICNETIDNKPPIQTIQFGNPQSYREWYGVNYTVVSCTTPIWINSTDPGGVGSSHINYSVWSTGNPYPNENGTIVTELIYEKTVRDGDLEDMDMENGSITVELYINESCYHEIIYQCWDYNNNTDGHRDIDFIADCCGPNTTKKVGLPQYGEDYPNWISCMTPLWFNSTDQCCVPNGTGVDYIEIKVWWKSNISDLEEPWKINKTVKIYDGDIEDQNGGKGRISYAFHFDDDCGHEIWWRGVDIFGNEESWKKQKHKVDCTPPEIIKTIGDPNCTIIPGVEYCVTTNTPITFYAEDRGCMGGVGLASLKYRIWNSTDGWSNWTYDLRLWGELIYFQEECTHYLEIVATDLLSNEYLDNETFHVDDTPPIIMKDVGDPNLPIMFVEIREPLGDFWISCETNITIDAYDPGCCGNLTYVGYNINDTGWVSIPLNELPKNITLTQCVHNLSIKAMDCLNNTEYHNETFYVDCTPPEINKTVGNPNCTIIPGEEYCVNFSTPITFCAEDIGCMGGVGMKNLSYRVWNVSHGWGSSVEVFGEVRFCETFYFTEECKHYLEITAIDWMDNVAIDNQTFWVDNTTPTIEKIVCDPNCTCDMEVDYCVTTETNITIYAYDLGCCDNFTLMIREWNETYDSGWIDITNSTPYNFSFEKECFHHLDIWAYDCLGHYVYDNETFYVDDTPPVINKTVGDPNCTIIPGAEYCVTNQTEITVEAYDMGCCQCEEVTIEYRIWYNFTWSKWESYEGPITFEKECMHYLEINATDCLGNSYIDNETFYVDDTPPEINKTVGEPNCQTECTEDDYCVSNKTEITVEATDLGCCPCDNVTIDYRIWFNGIWSKWTKYSTAITFDEECKHYLEINATDCLGNSYIDNETFYVDNTPPNFTKTVGMPSRYAGKDKHGHDIWDSLTTDTEINLTAVDPESCCPCQPISIKYRISIQGYWSEWINYTGNFTFKEGCTHWLEVNVSDCVGNYIIDNETFIVHGSNGPHIEIIAPEDDEVLNSRDDRYAHVKIKGYYGDDPNDHNITVTLWLDTPYGAPDLYYPVVWNNTEKCFTSDVDIYKYSTNSTLQLEAKGEDSYGGRQYDDVSFKVQTTVDYDFWMEEGWNGPINIAVFGCDESVESVFSSIDGHYEWIFEVGTWKNYYYGHGGNTLHVIDRDGWYWIKMINATRYYVDSHPPEVNITYPEKNSVLTSLIAINGTAFDIETDVKDVIIQIHDIVSDDYWNGTSWQGTSSDLPCDGTETWEYDDIGSVNWSGRCGHSFTIIAIATDMAGCSATDEVTFTFSCPEECPPGSGATVIPDYVEVKLAPGEFMWDNKTVITNEIPIGKLDVMFLFDLTGSMGTVINTAKTSAINIMENISSLVNDSAFGTGSFRDYNGYFSSCGYSSTYGSGSDQPWSLDQDITLNTTLVNNAINTYYASGGSDGPESYTRALYESLFVSWRLGARKIVIIFEDNVPHDCDYSTFGCGPITQGADPGRDATVGTSDDLSWVDVIDNLTTSHISVIVVDSSSSTFNDCPWIYAANETGGIFEQLGSASTLPEKIVALIENVTATINNLTLEPKGGFEDWFSWEPIAHSNVSGGETVEFNVSLTVPVNASAGVYQICLKVMGDGSILAVQELWITVQEEEV